MITETMEHRNRRSLLWIITSLALLVSVGFALPLDSTAPALKGLDPTTVRLGLGIFACIALLWLTEALPLAITALLIAVLAVGFGLMDVKTSLVGFADPLIFLFFGGFAMASALSSQGLDRWLANQIIKVGRGDFIKVSYLLFGVTALISMWVSNTATTAMMVPLAIGILTHLPPSASSHRNTVYLLLGIAYSASIGGIGTLVGSPPNGIAAAKLGLSFMDWIKFGVPAVLILHPILILAMKAICKPENLNIGKVAAIDFKFTRPRRVTLVIFVATAACWIMSAPLSNMFKIETGFDTFVVLVAVLALVTSRVVTWDEINKGTEWGVLLLFGGGITLSAVLGQTGTSLFIGRVFAEWVTGWPLPLVIGTMIGLVIFLTELASNTALTALMVPIFFSVSGELGLPPSQLVLPLAIAASCGFMMPVGTPPNGIVFATGLVPQREMIRTGVVLNGVVLVVLTLLAQVLF